MSEEEQNINDLEKELLFKASNGDANAFGNLFDLYYNKVLSHTLTFSKNFHAAEDLAQDIFLKVWNSRQKLVSIKNFKSYLFILVRNEMIDGLRKKAVELTNGPVPDFQLDSEFPYQNVESKEIYNSIIMGMDQLPPQQKHVFYLSRIEGKSNGEIAIELGIAKTTVRWHIVLALNFLKAYIANAGFKMIIILGYFIHTNII